MTTFSQLVDDVVVELVRPDMRAAIAAYVNQTLRELHFKPGSNAPIRYDANRNEDELTIDTDGSWSWTIPAVTRFQDIEAIYLNEIGIYVEKKSPRIALEPSFQPYADIFWYRSGPLIALSGVKDGWTGKISYFEFAQALGYKGSASRVVTFNESDGSYTVAGGGAPTQSQLDAETNWILQRWPETVKEGARAKTWKRIGDVDRARLSYSSFEASRESMWNSEPSSA